METLLIPIRVFWGSLFLHYVKSKQEPLWGLPSLHLGHTPAHECYFPFPEHHHHWHRRHIITTFYIHWVLNSPLKKENCCTYFFKRDNTNRNGDTYTLWHSLTDPECKYGLLDSCSWNFSFTYWRHQKVSAVLCSTAVLIFMHSSLITEVSVWVVRGN